MHPIQKTLLLPVTLVLLFACKKSNNPPSTPSTPPIGTVSITNVTPLTGGKNTALTITGANFSTTPTENEVFINGKAATVTGATATTLHVTVPASAGTGPVTIKRGSQTGTGPVFTYSFGYYEVTTLAGSSAGFADGKGNTAQFNTPRGLAIDKDGHLIVADIFNHSIRQVAADGTVTTIAGTGAAGYVNGAHASAQFTFPLGVTVDKNGTIYIADAGNNCIRKMELSGSTYSVSTLAGPDAPSKTSGFVNGTGSNARFATPTGITSDQAGNLYVMDNSNNSVRKIVASSGSVTTIAGGPTSGYRDGAGTTALFNNANSLATNPGGTYLLVTDTYNNNLREIAPLSGSIFVSTEAGSTSLTSGSQDGSYGTAQFNHPWAVAIDEPHGHIFVADAGNNCIRLLDVNTLQVKTFTGSKDQTGATDGPLSSATFNQPTGLAIDNTGNLYIADSQNHRIRRIAYE